LAEHDAGGEEEHLRGQLQAMQDLESQHDKSLQMLRKKLS
jgi:hypothetical protein